MATRKTKTPAVTAPSGSAAGKPAAKAPAPRGRKRTHTKPAVSREAQQAEQLTRVLYGALTAEGAPKASPRGYIMGATTLLKMLIDQAAAQGEDRGEMRSYALNLIARI